MQAPGDGGDVLVAGVACLILIASAVWAHYRFANYDRLPRQFGLTLKSNAFAPNWVMVWLLPGILIASLVFVAFLPSFVPEERINGDPETGLLIASVAVVGAQLFTLWLLTRWANRQA